jgi:hypothetical protein
VHFYGDIFRANFFDLKNSIIRQNNSDLDPLKGFGINFFWSNHPQKKPSLNSSQGSAKLSPLSPAPRPSEYCTDEDNIVNRSAMDALRY